MNNEAENKAKGGSSRKRWLIGLGLTGVAVLSFFGWRYFTTHKKESQENQNDAPDFSADNTSPNPKKGSTRNDAFPLKKGSKGANVKALQQALIAKYGKNLLPRYGADGDFGTELVTALKKVGLPQSIDENLFNVWVKKAGTDPAATASSLYAAALKKDFVKVMVLLKTIHNMSQYKAVRDEFVNYRINGVRQTLVNGLLNVFTNEKQKAAIRQAFIAMGLKYDGKKWSLSGISDTGVLITSHETRVWKNPKSSVSVPAQMVLGKEITKRGDFTLFENDKEYFLVQSKHVTYYNN